MTGQMKSLGATFFEKRNQRPAQQFYFRSRKLVILESNSLVTERGFHFQTPWARIVEPETCR